MSRHGKHVKTLDVVVSSHASEFANGFDNVAERVMSCPNITEFTLETQATNSRLFGTGSVDDDEGAQLGPVDLGALLAPLQALAPQLQSMDILTNWNTQGLAKDVSSLLRSTRDLRLLSLSPYDVDASFAFDETIPALGCMPFLTSLAVQTSNFLPENAVVCLPALKRLEVAELDPAGLARIYHSAGDTLETLVIENWSDDDNNGTSDSHAKPLLFPRLRRLHLSIYLMPENLLSPFFDSASPIETLSVFSLTAGIFDDLKVFLQKKRRQTLTKLIIENRDDKLVRIGGIGGPEGRRVWRELDIAEDQRIKDCLDWAATRDIVVVVPWCKPPESSAIARTSPTVSA